MSGKGRPDITRETIQYLFVRIKLSIIFAQDAVLGKVSRYISDGSVRQPGTDRWQNKKRIKINKIPVTVNLPRLVDVCYQPMV